MKSVSTENQLVCGLSLAALAVLLILAGWTIPFLFESSSILYKFGTEKVLLRSGKMVAITVVVLLFYQILLVSHITFLERVFFRKRLLDLHRFNGFLIFVLVMVHPLLIKASENFVSYTLEEKYYPEFVGIIVFLVVLTVLSTAILRKQLGIVWARWLVLHRVGATLVLLILPLHVLWVSDTFKSGVPRRAALAIFTINTLLIGWIWFRRRILL